MTHGARRATVSGMLTNSLEAAVAARSAAPPPAIEARGLRKSYGGVTALDGVDLTVRRGEVLALLGPNGAGKTTLVEILEGHREADAGEVDVLGFDPARRERAFRERIGIVLQDAALERELTVHEAIELFARAVPGPAAGRRGRRARRPRPRSSHARTRTLSGGQRRRLDVAVGIAGDPELRLPRRADHRLRSRRPPPVVGADRRPARPRPDDPADHALHGGGAAARRPRGRARRRPPDRGGRARRAGRRRRDGAGELPAARRGRRRRPARGGRRPRAGGRAAHHHADARPRAAALVGGRARLRARGADRQPPDASRTST